MGKKKNKKKEFNITLDQLKRAAPVNIRKSFSQSQVDSINKALKNSSSKEEFRENILSYVSVLGEGRFKMVDYLNAVKYVSHKLLGDSNIQAYTKVFPDRYQHFLDIEADPRHIAGHVSLYNKRVLVNKVLEQTIIPHHILNMGMYQEALNAQTELMINARSEMVRMNAANSILTHLKPPEVAKVELDINVNNDAVADLRDVMVEFARKQKAALEDKTSSVKEIAHSKIIKEFVDVDIMEE